MKPAITPVVGAPIAPAPASSPPVRPLSTEGFGATGMDLRAEGFVRVIELAIFAGRNMQ